MIVFYLFWGIMILISITLFSNLIINANAVRINNIDELKGIYHEYKIQKYSNILNHLEIEFEIKIAILGLIPIRIFYADSTKIRNIAKKIIEKDMEVKNRNKYKYDRKKQKQKEMTNKVIPKLMNCIDIENAELNANISLSDMGITAMTASALNIICSIIITCFYDTLTDGEDDKNIIEQTYNNLSNIYYKVNPVYTTDFQFSLDSKCKLKIPIISFICA